MKYKISNKKYVMDRFFKGKLINNMLLQSLAYTIMSVYDYFFDCDS